MHLSNELQDDEPDLEWRDWQMYDTKLESEDMDDMGSAEEDEKKEKDRSEGEGGDRSSNHVEG